MWHSRGPFFCGFYEHVHCPSIFTLAKETQIRKKKKKSPRRFVYIKEGQKDMTLSKIMACVICIIDVLLVLLFQTRPFFVCNANVIPSNHSILRKKCPFLSFFFFIKWHKCIMTMSIKWIFVVM